MGRISREEVLLWKCPRLDDGELCSDSLGAVVESSNGDVYGLRGASSAFKGGLPRFLCVTSTQVDSSLS